MATKDVKGVKRADGDTYLYKDAEARTKIGTATLTTTAQNLSGAVNELNAGKASLENGKVPVSQLPSYVDDVLEYANKASFPATGESGKIYVDLATNLTYRWSGSAYVEISPSLALGETSSTAYAGNKGKANADAIAVLNGTGTGSVSKAITNAINALDVSSVGGTGKYISAISEADGKISATEATMDEVPTQDSNKPVKSGGVFSAIDDSVSLKTATGNPIILTDAANANAEELSMTIEPIQDLHGYSKPWPAGGGKNLIDWANPSFSYSYNNSKYIDVDVSHGYIGTFHIQPNTIYTISYDIETGVKVFNIAIGIGNGSYGYDVKVRNNAYSSHVELTFSVSDALINTYGDILALRPCYYTSNVSTTFTITNFQLEVGSSATSFEPYSNICPISGLTEGKVTRTGNNLIDESALIAAEINPTTGQPSESNAVKITPMISIKSSATYLFAHQNGEFFRIFAYAADGTFIERSDLYTGDAVVTTGATWAYVRIQGANYAWSYADPVLTQTADITITFGQTVYGGSVNFKTGEVTVTHGIVDLGTLNWSFLTDRFITNLIDNKTIGDTEEPNMVCSSYPTMTWYYGIRHTSEKGVYLYNNILGANDSSYTDAAAFKTAMSGVQLCYELATPTTLTLTPAELELLKGNNTITANGAEISLSYYPDNAIGALAERVDGKADIPIVYDATPGPTTDYSFRYLVGYNENAGQFEYIHNDNAYARLKLDTNNKPHIVMWKAGYDSVNLTNTEALFKSYIHQLEYGINGIVGSGNSATYTVNLSQEKLSYLNNISSDVQAQIDNIGTASTTKSKTASISAIGWYRFAKTVRTSSHIAATGAAGILTNFNIQRLFNNNDNEAYALSLALVTNKPIFKVMNASVKAQLITKVRYVIDSASSAVGYLEFYYEGTTTNGVIVSLDRNIDFDLIDITQNTASSPEIIDECGLTGAVYSASGTVLTDKSSMIADLVSGKVDRFVSSSNGATQTIDIGTKNVNRMYLLSVGYSTQYGDHYAFGLIFINDSARIKYMSLVDGTITVSATYTNGIVTLTFSESPYSNAALIRLS